MLKSSLTFFLLTSCLSIFCQLNTNAINATFTEFVSFIESIDNEILLDVRPKEELNKDGFHEAVSVPSKIVLSDFIYDVKKSTPILVYCNQGDRSVIVCNILIEEGFETVINLEPGIAGFKKEIKKFNRKQL